MAVENALQRQRRLLCLLNERFTDPDVPDMSELKLVTRREACEIVNEAGEVLITGQPFLIDEFLAAPVARQVQMMVENKE